MPSVNSRGKKFKFSNKSVCLSVSVFYSDDAKGSSPSLAEEGKAALEAKKSGMVLDLWKVVAERKVATFSHSHIVSNTFNGSRLTLENRHVHFSVP